MKREQIKEKLRVIRNRCDTALILMERKNSDHLLHTLLEDICASANDVTLGFCVALDKQDKPK